MPKQKYTFDVYKFLKLIAGIANVDNYIKIFSMTQLQFKLRNGMLSIRFICSLVLTYVHI